MNTGVPAVLGSLRLLERHTLGADGTLGAVPEFLSRLIETGLVVGEQRGPVIRVRVEAECMRPDGQLLRGSTGFSVEELALCVREVGDVLHRGLVLGTVLVVHLVALVREWNLSELRLTGGVRRVCARRRCSGRVRLTLGELVDLVLCDGNRSLRVGLVRRAGALHPVLVGGGLGGLEFGFGRFQRSRCAVEVVACRGAPGEHGDTQDQRHKGGNPGFL